ASAHWGPARRAGSTDRPIATMAAAAASIAGTMGVADDGDHHRHLAGHAAAGDGPLSSVLADRDCAESADRPAGGPGDDQRLWSDAAGLAVAAGRLAARLDLRRESAGDRLAGGARQGTAGEPC